MKKPDYLYRYRSLAGDGAKYVKETICDSTLYFSSSSSFNDPFDCRPSFVYEATDDELFAYYSRILGGFYPSWSVGEREVEARKLIEDPSRTPKNPDNFKNFEAMHEKNTTENLGVLCLASGGANILMWSHYADSHKGVCLEFDFADPFFSNAQQVRYARSRPRPNPFRDNNFKLLDDVVLTKADLWAYEEEWRLLQYRNGPGVYPFSPRALTGVVLGALISTADEEKVRSWIAAREFPTKIYRASICRTTFSVLINEEK